jgi:S-adenosylmethionine decarboxylase
MSKKEEYKALNAQMFHYDKWITEVNPNQLKKDIETLLNYSEFTIVNFTEHFFPVKGYTAVWLLAESHLAIHTFPDKHKTYLQISSCNEKKLQTLKEQLVSF